MISYQKGEYDMFKHHFKRSFSIELDDQNCFPNEKDFVYPNSLVIQAALENYCLKNGIHLEYISKYKPITFILDGKTKYTAEAQLIRGRFDNSVRYSAFSYHIV